MPARQADPSDAAELVRLRAVLLQTMAGPGWDDEWREPARQSLVARLAGPDLAGFVVDRPDADGLAACAVGVVQHRLGFPGDPSGLSGYVFNVATDPAYRRRGYSRACVTALLDWFRALGIHRVELRASKDGEALYRDLGFTEGGDPALRARI